MSFIEIWYGEYNWHVQFTKVNSVSILHVQIEFKCVHTQSCTWKAGMASDWNVWTVSLGQIHFSKYTRITIVRTTKWHLYASRPCGLYLHCCMTDYICFSAQRFNSDARQSLGEFLFATEKTTRRQRLKLLRWKKALHICLLICSYYVQLSARTAVHEDILSK